MLIEDCYRDAHGMFGIDEVYIHEGLDRVLLKKLQQRSVNTLDDTNTVVKNHVSYDMLFIFHKKVATTSSIYRFLEFLTKHPDKERDFRKLHALVNVEELFEAIQEKKFVLVTSQDISSDL